MFVIVVVVGVDGGAATKKTCIHTPVSCGKDTKVSKSLPCLNSAILDSDGA